MAVSIKPFASPVPGQAPDVVIVNTRGNDNILATGLNSVSTSQQSDATAIAALQTTLSTIVAGTYTPTLTNTTNVAASTAYLCQYLRVGATVTVSGKVDVDPTAAGQVQLGISLPVASNFGAVTDCGGAAAAIAVAGQSAGVYADATNDRMTMEWIAVDTANRAMFFTATYRVI